MDLFIRKYIYYEIVWMLLFFYMINFIRDNIYKKICEYAY